MKQDAMFALCTRMMYEQMDWGGYEGVGGRGSGGGDWDGEGSGEERVAETGVGQFVYGFC